MTTSGSKEKTVEAAMVQAPLRSGLFGWMWRRYLRQYKWQMALAMAIMSVEGAMFGVLAYMMKPMFDQVLIGGSSSALVWVGLVVMASFFIRAVASIAQKIIVTRVSEKSVAAMRLDLLAHLLRLDLDYHQSNGPGYLIQRVEGDVQGILQVWTTIITGAGRDFVSLISLLGVAIFMDWQWTLIAMIGAPLLVLPAMVMQRFVRRRAREARELSGHLSARLNEAFLAIAPVKLNRLENYQVGRYRALTEGRITAETRAAFGKASLPGMIDIMSGIGFVGVLFLGGREILNGTKEVGDFMAFFTAIGLTFEPMRRLGALSGVWQVAAASIERIKGILDTMPALRDPDMPLPPPNGTPDIALDAVTLSYGETQVLHGLSFTAEAGKTTALVGASGAGKTTVFNLLTRMNDPQGGTVAIGGIPVSMMRLGDLRDMMSVVSQEALLFDESLRENIVLDRDASEEDVQHAIETAHVADFLPRLDNGLKTVVGPRGSALSGGQRQRVAIARAVLRDTPILLLDEATSALDTQSEAVVQSALEKLSRGRTTLVIAHRLSTVRNADKIVVMDRGRVVEQGTHDELLAINGAYADLYKMQFDG